MRILYAGVLLASSDPALGRTGPAELACNGQPILDVAQFLRASYAQVYGRGDGPVEVAFSVWRLFASEAEVLSFIGTHREALTLQEDLTLTDDEQTIALTMADAVRQVGIAEIRGLSLRVEYRFTGSRFESDAVPEPTEPNTVKTSVTTLTAGEVSKAVTWSPAFSDAPRFVRGEVQGPASADGGVGVLAFLSGDPTAAGCTFEFSQAIPASGTYKLRVFAAL